MERVTGRHTPQERHGRRVLRAFHQPQIAATMSAHSAGSSEKIATAKGAQVQKDHTITKFDLLKPSHHRKFQN